MRLYKDPTYTEQLRKQRRARERDEQPTATRERMQKAHAKRARRRKRVLDRLVVQS